MINGILSGNEIHNEIRSGKISISPYDPEHLNPASYDLTLGNKLSVYKDVTVCDFGGKIPGERLYPRSVGSHHFLDSSKPCEVSSYEFGETGFLLKPGIGYLMHTNEVVSTDHYVPIIDGKSSVGRLFIQIHATAGLGDPGFSGQYTLEVIVTFPVKVFPNMRIGQVRFYDVRGEITNYKTTGHYVGGAAMGPIPSQLYKSFRK
jgi:dCTP deaminase